MLRRRAFTLIELLMVCAIILVLLTLIVGAAYPRILSLAKDRETARRLDAVVSGIEMYGHGQALSFPRIFAAITGRDTQLVSLRESISTLLGHRPDLLTTTDAEHFPPRLRTRAWIVSTGAISGRINSGWRMPGHGLDHHIAFHDRQLPPVTRATVFAPIDLWTPVDRNQPMFTVVGTFSNLLDRDYKDSPIGESLDRTVEAKPTGAWRTSDFYAAWPNLTEVISGDGTIYTQTSWRNAAGHAWHRDADPPRWTGADSGVEATPIWGMPWGERVISRNPNRGYQVDYRESHALSTLNPLVTPVLLELSGVLADAATWRQDRNPKAAWNDAWGNPLLLAAAAFHAPRYDFDDLGELRGNPPRVLHSRELKGPRDWLWRAARETFGYGRAIYLSAGSAGEVLHEPLPESWSASEDPAVIRALWRQVLEVTDGAEWTQDAFVDPPWERVRKRSAGEATSFITAPVILQDR